MSITAATSSCKIISPLAQTRSLIAVNKTCHSNYKGGREGGGVGRNDTRCFIALRMLVGCGRFMDVMKEVEIIPDCN